MEDNAAPRTREDRLLSLYKKGKASSLEILEADFGHWPPRGLDIVVKPTGHVKFMPGMATMMMNPFHWVQSVSILGVLVGYTLSAMTGYVSVGFAYCALVALRQASLALGYIKSGQNDSGPRNIYINEALDLKARFNDAAAKEKLADVIAHEHTHIFQADDTEFALKSPISNPRFNLDQKLVKGAGPYIAYLARDCEIQARLHVVVSYVYRTHGYLPLDKAQLEKAMNEDVAENLPASVKDSFSQIRIVYIYLPPDEREKYWTDTMPRLYGRLLEYYGDSQGSARMGYGHNERLREIFRRHAANIDQDLVTREKPRRSNLDALGKVLERMIPNHAEELLQMYLAPPANDDMPAAGKLKLSDSALKPVVNSYRAHSRMDRDKIDSLLAAHAPHLLTPALPPPPNPAA